MYTSLINPLIILKNTVSTPYRAQFSHANFPITVYHYVLKNSASIDISIENQMYLKRKRSKICSSLSTRRFRSRGSWPALSRSLQHSPWNQDKKGAVLYKQGSGGSNPVENRGGEGKIKEGTVGSQAWQSFTDANSIGKIRRGRNVSKGRRRRRRLAAWNFYFSSDARPFIWLNSTRYVPRFRPNFTDLPGGNRSGTRNKRGEQRRNRDGPLCSIHCYRDLRRVYEATIEML